MELLERIIGEKEEPKAGIRVPMKWSKGFPELVSKKPNEACELLFEMQNEIIECLEQIKEAVEK